MNVMYHLYHIYVMYIYPPGQGESQAFFWTFCPGQDFSERGVEQIRPRWRKPRPQDTLQADQLDQSLQPPDTEKLGYKLIIIENKTVFSIRKN